MIGTTWNDVYEIEGDIITTTATITEAHFTERGARVSVRVSGMVYPADLSVAPYPVEWPEEEIWRERT